MSVQRSLPGRLGAATWDVFVTYVWTRKALLAIALVSNSILQTVGGVALSASIEQRIASLTQRRSSLLQEMTSLDQLTATFEANELLRTSFGAVLKGVNAEDALKYGIDQLYRQDAHGTLRRLTAALYPDNWREKSAGYDALLSSRYDSLDAVQKLTTMENDVIVAARSRLTADQADVDALAGRIDNLSRWRNVAQIVLSGLTNLLVVIVFFYKAEHTT